MANRFPLIVNSVSKKIEELVSGDNLDLTGNGILAGSSLGTSGQYLKSTGTTIAWDAPGDVYLTATQTITNKTFEACSLSGSTNTFINISNASLVNSSITVNGVAIALGGTVTTPDNNTTYSISAQDGAAGKKIIRLTSGGNSGSGVDDDVTLVAGTNVTLNRVAEEITINSSYIDTNTVTRVAASGGVLTSGDITIAAAGASTIAQVGSTITVTSVDTNTVTRLRGTASGTYTSGDLSILASGTTTVAQSGSDITISSVDTITRVRGTGGTLTSGDITIAASGSSTVSQSGNTITIDSSYVDTITRLRGGAGGTYTSGDLTITATGASSVAQNGSTVTITSTDTNTTYTAATAGGLTLTGTAFAIKNTANLTNAYHTKWDTGNNQLINTIISDDGSTATIHGDLTVTGNTTTITSETLVIADAQIELRKGLSLTGADSGIQVNRTTNNLGIVATYASLQWFESGGYWRSYNGSVDNRFVTEGETQTLANKTLTSPTLTSPTLGVATVTTLNGLAISSTVTSTLTIANNKTLTCNNTLTFSGTDASTVGFGAGGTVVYTTNSLSVFASTTSAQLRGVLSDETGTGVAVFGTSPTITTSIVTGNTTFSVFNTTATTINAFGIATTITLGATTGTTTIRNSLTVNGSTNLGDVVGDTVNINGTLNIVNADFTVRGSTGNPLHIGRGGNDIASNTRVGYNALNSNTSGSQNTAFGFEAALTINSGASIVALGYRALRSASIGQYNIAVGRDAMLSTLNGEKNIGVGVNALEGCISGIGNVAIGYYAGAGCTGNGNVLIGPSPDGTNANATFSPPTPSGDNQLVIGSGSSTWIRGDSNFDVTFPQNANVGGNFTISGNLTVNGTTTTINTNVLSVDDKLIDLADVIARNFVATIVSGNATITAITPVTGLIPGMAVSITTAGLSVPNGTTIISITNNTAVLSNVVTGSSGNATFTTTGATNLTADGGGIRVKGTTDKSITYTDSLSTWTSTENFDLATGKVYRVGNVQVASGSQIGPSTGSLSLGAGVTASSLTSVGTLTSLSVTGNLTVDTDTLYVDATNNRVGIGTPSPSKKLEVAGDIVMTGLDGFGINYAANAGSCFLDRGGALTSNVQFGGTTSNINIGAGGGFKINLGKSECVFTSFPDTANVGQAITLQERMRIDTSGRLLVGTTTDRFSTKILVESTNGTSGITVARASNDSGPPYKFFIKSRGATVGSNTVVQSGDMLGFIGFYGTDGAAPISGASIYAAVDDDPGADDMPGRLVFSTNPGSPATSPTERLIIGSTGKILAGALTSINGASFQISTDSGASTSPYLAVFNTASSPTSAASTRLDLGFLSGAANYNATNTVLGAINWMGQGNDAGYGGAFIKGIVTSGGNVARASGHGVNLIFGTKPTNTAGAEERARIDSSGRLLVGTTSSFNGGLFCIGSGQGTNLPSGEYIKIAPSANRIEFLDSISNASDTGSISLYNTVYNNRSANIKLFHPAGNTGGIAFETHDGTSLTERMSISAGGNVNIIAVTSSAGGTHTMQDSGASPNTLRLYNVTDSNNTGNRFLICDAAASIMRAEIRSNGGLANYSANNANLSDRNVKKDITLAAGTWDCIKEWEIVNYRYKDQPDDADLNLGVIAQQVAESCPEVITIFQEAKEATEDKPAQEERLGVKEQQMYWMAIKGLQEAMKRIETLETEVAALKTA